jgi:hypothetical protein
MLISFLAHGVYSNTLCGGVFPHRLEKVWPNSQVRKCRVCHYYEGTHKLRRNV